MLKLSWFIIVLTMSHAYGATRTETLLEAISLKLSTLAKDRTTAAVPFACRLSDGSGFYNASGGGGGGGGDGAIVDGTSVSIKAVVKSSAPSGSENALVVRNVPSGTQAVSVASLPLPSGASTESTLSAMSAKLPSSLGQKTMANSLACTLASDQSSIPVTGTFWQTTQPVSGSVSVSNFPSSQAVTGTFWQSTQPISAASLPLPSGASTSAKQPALGTAGTASSDVITVQGIASMTALKVDGSAVTQPVSGTFWQATQPVSAAALPLPSGAATSAKQPALGTAGSASADVISVQGIASMTALKVDGSAVTQPVSGTFWQATQPVSLASLPALAAGSALVGKVGIDQTTPGTTNKVSIGTDGTVTVNALPAGTNRIGSVRLVDSADADLTTAKGTQASRGVGIQELKDTGRTHINLWASGVASGATGVETAITMTKSSGTSATSSAASFAVTNGKTFRITSITVGSRGHLTATAQATNFNLRINTAGAVTASSTPIVFSCGTATPATALAWDRCQIPIPDGFEIVGTSTLQFGLTAAATFVTNAPTWYATITGYEY